MKFLCSSFWRFSVVLIFSILFVSCSKEAKTETPTELIAETNASVANTTTNQFLTIKTNGKWSASVNYVTGATGWVSLSSTSGTGNSNLILLFSQNTAPEIRVAEIIVTASEKVVKIPLTQEALVIIGGRATNSAWIEIPSGGSNSDCVTFSHEITIGYKTVRNYSMMYDKKEKVAYWVAYPHHPLYIGGTGRTDNWQPDPMVPTASQPNYFSGISGYDRGHQIPSADRTVSNAANSQTFYFTNMTPQLSVLNGQIWASLEGQVRNWMAASDTLYVVTGAVLKTVNGNETVNYATDSKGTKVAVPNYYYKVLLRLKTGKYDAIGFWFEHKSYGSGGATSSVSKSVRQIETLTGLNFFAILPKATQDDAEMTITPAAWGL
jgi:endonuclease G